MAFGTQTNSFTSKAVGMKPTGFIIINHKYHSTITLPINLSRDFTLELSFPHNILKIFLQAITCHKTFPWWNVLFGVSECIPLIQKIPMQIRNCQSRLGAACVGSIATDNGALVFHFGHTKRMNLVSCSGVSILSRSLTSFSWLGLVGKGTLVNFTSSSKWHKKWNFLTSTL